MAARGLITSSKLPANDWGIISVLGHYRCQTCVAMEGKELGGYKTC